MITYFYDDDNRKFRVLLYTLELEGIVKLVREKDEELYNFRWELTRKCIDLV